MSLAARNREPGHRLVTGGGETMVRKAFQDECDVNKIVARYKKTGILPRTNAEGRFEDVSQIGDYKTAMDTVQAAREGIVDLPPEAQQLFERDPQGWMETLGRAQGVDQLVALGLIPPREPEAGEDDVEPQAAPEED